jgi:CRISPR-associated exonuclease Cas4
MIYLGLALLLLALVLFFLSGRQQRAAGLPGGRVVYSDTGAGKRVEKALFDRELGLTGKPDYLVERDGRLIPVEVKSGRAPQAPYDSHIFQLAAYCKLVESATGVRPPYGIIRYAGRSFAVDYTPQLESALLDLLAEVRRDERRDEVHRSHQEPNRCRSCGFRELCEERLA